MTTKWPLKLLGKNNYQQGKGSTNKKHFDDLDLIVKELRTTKANLLKNLNNQNILIQMKKFKVNWALGQGGYIQATYQVLNQGTGEEKWVEGNIIGNELITGVGSLDEVNFEEGEYISELSARYEKALGFVSNFKLEIHSTLTSKNRTFSAVTIPWSPITSESFKLKNVACLTGYGGGINCNGVGAWQGEVVKSQVQIADPWDQVNDLNTQVNALKLEKNKWEKFLSSLNVNSVEELGKLIDGLKLNAEQHQAGDLKPSNLPADWQQQIKEKDEWTSRFPGKTAQQIENQLASLGKGPSQQDFDDLKQKFLDDKKDQIGERIEKMIESFETELGLWSVNLRKDIRDFLGADYYPLLTKYLTLNKLNDDNYFKQVENTIKFVVYTVASERAEGIQKKPVLQSNTTDHDTKKDMIVLFNKLCSIDIPQLFPIETDVTKNPLYSTKVGTAIGKLSTYKTNNVTLLEKWKVKPATSPITSTPIIIRKRELEKLMNDFKEKLKNDDYDDLNEFLEASEEVTKTGNEYAKKQIEKIKKRLLKSEEIEEEYLTRLSQIQTELINLKKELEGKIETAIEISPKTV